MQRRHFIQQASLSLLTLPALMSASQVSTAAASRVPLDRSLSLFNIHTGETLEVTYANADGLIPDHCGQLNWFLRDHRENESFLMDTTLFDQLWTLQVYLQSTGILGSANGVFEVYSAYRTQRTNAMLRARSNAVARKSYHMSGRAIDLRLRDVDLAVLCNAARKLEMGGVGNYPGASFIHLDTGPVRTWGPAS